MTMPPTPTPNPNPSPATAPALTLAEIFHPLTQDGRVGSRHISTYLALLQCRERHLRAGPFYIDRDEIMHLAKIQGRNTYYRTMSELDAWGYIEYSPSRRSSGATKVFLPAL